MTRMRVIFELFRRVIQQQVYLQLCHAYPTTQCLNQRVHDNDNCLGIYALYLLLELRGNQYLMHPDLEPMVQLGGAKFVQLCQRYKLKFVPNQRVHQKMWPLQNKHFGL